ncbi:MAG: chemotaxis protein CheR [Sphingobacteriaceae bacterium]|nr:chemotaxis protein CheR [Sphingobacteriaceae bacterium]
MNESSQETSNRVEITDEELISLTTAVKTRYGIDFTSYEKKSLKRGFARLIARNDLGSMVGLWSKILKDKEFLIKYIDDLLVNLTELFRNPEIWLKIKDDILEKLRSKPIINIWHAGCSTGEEIYTMAIVLKEQGLLLKTRALATDLSTTALETAKQGIYSKILWKKYSASYLTYYPKGNPEYHFTVNENDIVVSNNLKNHVTFLRHNLVQDSMNKKFHIIFCRNVMIYFDETLKMKVLKLFYDSLEDDGFFIIGYYDMLPEASKDLFVLYDATTRIYRKNKLNT